MFFWYIHKGSIYNLCCYILMKKIPNIYLVKGIVRSEKREVESGTNRTVLTIDFVYNCRSFSVIITGFGSF
jgi:hypothetical protein